MDDDPIRRACESLEAAFAGREGFADALGLAAAAAGARGAAILPVAGQNDLRPVSRAIEDLAHEYDAYWHAHDFRYATLGKMLRTGVAVDQDAVSPDAMARLPFYSDFLARHGLRWFAGVPFRDGADVWCLTFQRTPGQGSYEADEQDRLRRFGCALSPAVSAARHLAAARADGVLEGLDASGSAALLLDGRCRVTEINGSLSDALRRDLDLRPGRPLLGASPLAAALRARMSAVVAPATPPDHPGRLPLVVPRPGRRPLVLRLRALRGAGARFHDRAVAVAVVDDLDRRDRKSVDMLVHVFGLTPGQARIAALIGAGATIADCARDLHVDVETVRSGLHKAFGKVGVRRQADLVQVIARLSPR